MALSTYSELKSAIAGTLDRDDLTDQIDDFIDLAEARHKRDIRIREMLSRDSLTLTLNSRFADLPTGFLEAQVVRLVVDANGTALSNNVLTSVNTEEITRLRLEEKNRPKFYTVHTQIEFDVPADQAYAGEIIYYKALTPLSDSNTSNDLLTRAPDAYLYGALIASAPHLMHDERIAVWGDLYVATRNDLNKSDVRARHPGQLASKVYGTTP